MKATNGPQCEHTIDGPRTQARASAAAGPRTQTAAVSSDKGGKSHAGVRKPSSVPLKWRQAAKDRAAARRAKLLRDHLFTGVTKADVVAFPIKSGARKRPLSTRSRCCQAHLRHPDSFGHLAEPGASRLKRAPAWIIAWGHRMLAEQRAAYADSVDSSLLEDGGEDVAPEDTETQRAAEAASKAAAVERSARHARRATAAHRTAAGQRPRAARARGALGGVAAPTTGLPAPKRRRGVLQCVAARKGVLLGYCDADRQAGLLLSPAGAIHHASTQECRKTDVEWCEGEIERQRVAIAASQSSCWHAYEPGNFEPVREHALTRMEGTQRSSTAVPVLVATRYVYRFVPTEGKWLDENGKPRNPFRGTLFTERGVSVLCTMVRSQSHMRQRRVVKQDGQPNGRKKVVPITRRGQQATSSYHEWRHVVATPLADESGMPLAARAVRVRLASLQASPYQVRVSPVLVGAKALNDYVEQTHDKTRAQALLRHAGKGAARAPEFKGASEVGSHVYASTAGTFVPLARPARRETIVGNDM